MSTVIDAVNLRQMILDHPLLESQRPRLQHLKSMTIFMSAEALRKILDELNQEAIGVGFTTT